MRRQTWRGPISLRNVNWTSTTVPPGGGYRVPSRGDARSGEQLCHLGHGNEQAAAISRQRQKPISGIERRRDPVLGIDHEGEGGDLAAQGTAERIEQEPLAQAFAPMDRGDDKPAHQGRGDERVAWQPPGLARREIGQADGSGRQGVVVSRDRVTFGDEHEAGGDTLADLLARLHAHIAIQGIDAARELRAVVLVAQWLDAKRWRRRVGHSAGDGIEMAAGRRAEPLGGLARIEQGLGEGSALLNAKADRRHLLDRAQGGLMGAIDDEIGQCPPPQVRRPLEQGLLLGRKTCLEPLGAGSGDVRLGLGCRHGRLLLLHLMYGILPGSASRAPCTPSADEPHRTLDSARNSS